MHKFVAFIKLAGYDEPYESYLRFLQNMRRDTSFGLALRSAKLASRREPLAIVLCRMRNGPSLD